MRTEHFDFVGEGHRLSGAIDFPEGDTCAYALLAHCFTCSKSTLATLRIARELASLGIAVLRYDFTGLGSSFISLDRADHLLTNVADAQYAADMIATWASRFVSEASNIRTDKNDACLQ